MTTYYSFRPEFFNQNGDQANLEALQYFSLTHFEPAPIENADFVLIGDASRAVMREFEDELIAMVPLLQARFDAGSPTLLVGSAYEFFASRIQGMPEMTFGQRSSKFAKWSDGSVKVFGYRNSEVVSPEVFIKGCFVGTLFFGPVLAKNPDLLELFSEAMKLSLKIDDSAREILAAIERQTTFD